MVLVSVPSMLYQPSIVFDKLTFQYFSHVHGLHREVNLSFMQRGQKTNLGSSFEQILEALSSQCIILSFKVLNFSVLEKKTF